MITIDHKYGITSAHCDSCSDFEEIEGTSMLAMVQKIKDLGWTFRKLTHGWFHTCPACIEKQISEAGLTHG